MEYIVAFDYAACAILFALISVAHFKKLYRFESGRFFIILLFFTFVTAIFDVLAVTKGVSNTFLWVMNGCYHLFRSATPLLYAMYLISYTDTFQKVLKNWKMMVLIIAPFLINFCFLSTNPFHKMSFSIADDGTYSRGPFLFIQYGMSVVYLAIGVVYIAKYSRYYSKSKLFTLYSFYAATLVSLLIQYFVPNLLIELFMNAASFLFYLTSLHRPEEMVDSNTGLYNESTFLMSVRRGIDFKKDTYVVLGHLYNFQTLMTLYDTKTSAELLKKMSNRFLSIGKGLGVRAACYTSKRGDFNAILEVKNKEDAVAYASALEDFLIGDHSGGRGQFRGKAKVALVHQPTDFPNYEAFAFFAAEYWQYDSMRENIIDVEKYSSSKAFQAVSQINLILDKAIISKSFEMYYQPIYDVKKQKFTAAEALLRLNTEEYGFVPPQTLVAFAERTGQISDVTDIVLEKVFDFVKSDDFKRLGLESIEVNLSIANCLDDTLIDRITAMLEDWNIDPSSLNFEVTETYTTEQRDRVKEFLDKLRALGCKTSVDDFGTGYSNFARLADLEFHMIKLDRSLVLKREDEKVAKIIPSIIYMGKTLGQCVVVEGIETEEERLYFEKYKVEYMQGYLFSKPISQSEFLKFIEEHN